MPNNMPLGKQTGYQSQYDASLLFAVPRQPKRDEMGITATLAFKGIDIWNAYELSWLNNKGKPIIAAARINVPCESENIFESKSLKLYFNSFNQSQFTSIEQVQEIIVQDLSAITKSAVNVEFILPDQFEQQTLHELPGKNIDDLDITVTQYQPDARLLQTTNTIVTECLQSHLLKSNCLITAQPDWASIMIDYTGKQIDQPSLLRYLISFRQHNEFHEQCVERIFTDIKRQCQPEKLTVYARYTRRGGIDINPIRTDLEVLPSELTQRSFRQ